VLSAAVEALPENRALGEILKVPVMDDGFFLEAHAKLRPVDFASEGIFVAGLAHGPKNIDESIAQALAAAGRAGVVLSHETLEANAVVSSVDEQKCISCLTCVRICPYDAPAPRADGIVEIPAVKCQGCGLCAAACPGKAIQLGKFRDEQIDAMITAFGGRM
jgi:heterodisulfide reductase subunit A